jgi:hypothetical protein
MQSIFFYSAYINMMEELLSYLKGPSSIPYIFVVYTVQYILS